MSTRSDEDFAREVESHVRLEADRLEQEGLAPAEARLAAQKRFGNATRVRETFYYSRRSAWLDHLAQDVRSALRGMRKYPVACAIAVVSLGAGIGAATATLVMRDAIFLAPPPLYLDPAALSFVRVSTPQSQRRPAPAGLFQQWSGDELLRGGLAASTPGRPQDVRIGDRVDAAGVRQVTANLFTLLGVTPALGTGFDTWPEAGQAPVMLSHAAWRRLLDGRADIVGRPLFIDGEPHIVIGVMPERFWFSTMDPAIWTRLRPERLSPEIPLEVVVRRPAALSQAALVDRVRAGTAAYAGALPADQRELRARVEPVRGTPLGNMVGPIVIVLLTGAVFLTLLIACTNVAVLMMAQWTSREHEIAIRASLGGARGRIVRSLLTESSLIALMGGTLGVCLTFALRGVIRRGLASAPLYDLSIDPAVLVQSAAITIAAGVLTGVAPALYETRRLHVNPLNAIHGSDRVRQRWRHALVVFEIATTVALLVVTGAMLSSYTRVLNGDLGFDPHPLLNVRADNPNGVPAEAILERLRGLAGVASVEAATAVPFFARGPMQAASAHAGSGNSTMAQRIVAGPRYFETLNVAMRSGRRFSDADTRGSSPVAVVNDVLAMQLWNTTHGVGRLVWVEGRPLEVVGVAAGYSYTAIQPPRPVVYSPLAQLAEAPRRVQFLVRASGDSSAMTQTVRREIASLGGGTTVAMSMTIDQMIEIIGQEFMASTYPLLPLIATGMLLTAAGIYGVLAFAVTRRSTELAVRVAVGATGADLMRLVAAHSVRMLAVGCVFGVGLTFALSRIAQGRGGIFDSPGWAAFVVPMLVIVTIGAAATWIPMRSALRINPSSLLRTT